MANIVFRLPSKQIQYGYVEVSGTPEEFGIHSVADADAIGITYAHYVNRYLEGEVEGVRQATAINDSAQTAIPTPKKAPGKPVKGVSGVRQVVSAEELVGAVSSPRTVPEADDMAKALIEKELGATVIEDSTEELSDDGQNDDAPWGKTSPEIGPKPKPWENNATPKVAKIDW